MGRSADWLSEKQLETLRWVKDGCPDDSQEVGYERRISARSLAHRGLAKIGGRGPSWHAIITPAGLERLEVEAMASSPQARVDALVRRVVAAGGRLEIADNEFHMYNDELRRRFESSQLRPRGWLPERRYTGPWANQRTEIVLVKHAADLVDEEPVPVPSTVARYHPLVKAYLADRHTQLVTKEHLPRAARLLQALVEEAPRRGLAVQGTKQARQAGGPNYLAELHWHVVIVAANGACGIRIQEASAPGGEPIARHRWGSSRRARWLDAREREFISTGTLELFVEGPGMAHGGTHFRDAKTVPLEDKLPRIFRRIEVHRIDSEWRDEERKREEADQRRRWEAAMAEAKRRYVEQARWDDFQRRSREWRELTAHRECSDVSWSSRTTFSWYAIISPGRAPDEGRSVGCSAPGSTLSILCRCRLSG